QAVIALVRRTHDSADFSEEAAHLRKDLLALDRVQTHHRPFVLRERSTLADDLEGYANLADVVQERCQLGHAALPCTEPEQLRDVDRERDDLAAVKTGVGVAGFDDLAEQERRALVGVAHLQLLVDPPLPLPREDGEQA